MKIKLILTATPIMDGYYEATVSFDDGSELDHHVSSTLQYARFDAIRIAKKFISQQIDQDNYEIVDNITPPTP